MDRLTFRVTSKDGAADLHVEADRMVLWDQDVSKCYVMVTESASDATYTTLGLPFAFSHSISTWQDISMLYIDNKYWYNTEEAYTIGRGDWILIIILFCLMTIGTGLVIYTCIRLKAAESKIEKQKKLAAESEKMGTKNGDFTWEVPEESGSAIN